MPNTWPLVPLGEVLTQYQEYIDAPEPKEYPKLSVRLYGKGVVLDTPANGSSLKMQRHQLAKSGQVILSEIWGKKGAIGFVPEEGNGALCTSHFFLFDIQKDKLGSKYLQAIFTSNYLEEQLGADAKGTTGYAAVRPRNLLVCKIPLPPLDEQRRIVARIEGLAAKIEEARRLSTEAGNAAEALFPSASRNIFGNPQVDGWKGVTLERCCENIIDYRGRTPPPADNGIPHLTSANIKHGRIDWITTKFVSEETYRNYMTRGIPKPGDLIFTMEAPLGDCAIVPDERMFSLAQRTLLLRPNRDLVSSEFLAKALTTPGVREAIYAKATGTTVKGIASKRLKHVILPVAPLSEQGRIVTYLDGLQAKVDALKKLQAETAAKLDALLPSILDKAFKGEL